MATAIKLHSKISSSSNNKRMYAAIVQQSCNSGENYRSFTALTLSACTWCCALLLSTLWTFPCPLLIFWLCVVVVLIIVGQQVGWLNSALEHWTSVRSSFSAGLKRWESSCFKCLADFKCLFRIACEMKNVLLKHMQVSLRFSKDVWTHFAQDMRHE